MMKKEPIISHKPTSQFAKINEDDYSSPPLYKTYIESNIEEVLRDCMSWMHEQ